MKDKKIDGKKLAKQVLAIVVLLAVAYVGKVTYDYIYKQGYESGAKNQLICSASVRDETLKPLCK